MIGAKVLADSISPDGVRLTTMEVTMHRFVLAEFNTHRVFSRNSASSRAIPIERQIKNIRDGIAYPFVWPRERPGMQGSEEEIDDLTTAALIWAKAADDAINHALRLRELGLHKSVTNRLLEPFMYHKVIVSSTEWENFFALRCHYMAQPEIRRAAEHMQAAYVASTPVNLGYGEWHTPFVGNGFWSMESPEKMEVALKTSAACAAWVSTSNHDGEHSWEAVNRMYDRLSSAEPMHASPFEHQATPGEGGLGNLVGWQQLRHMVEAGEPPWAPIMLGHPEPDLLEGIGRLEGDDVIIEYDIPSRAGREGDTQPLPVSSDAPIAHQMVAADLADRLALGIQRYGQPLQAHNGRDSLQDAYEEALDLVVYLKNAIYERDHPK